MNTAHSDAPRVPVVLPLVDVTIEKDGTAVVAIDAEPYDASAPIDRTSLAKVIHAIADDKGPVRVHVTESDGSEFTDVVVPGPPGADASPNDRIASTPGIGGNGFLPDEDVDVAVIVARQKADSAGTAQMRVPPALLAGRTGVLVLIGRTSRVVTVCDPA